MGLRDIKVPKMKFKKMKMDVMEELNEIDYEKLEKKNLKKKCIKNFTLVDTDIKSYVIIAISRVYVSAFTNFIIRYQKSWRAVRYNFGLCALLALSYVCRSYHERSVKNRRQKCSE